MTIYARHCYNEDDFELQYFDMVCFNFVPTLIGLCLTRIARKDWETKKKAYAMIFMHTVMLLGLLFGFVGVNGLIDGIALWKFSTGCVIAIFFQTIANGKLHTK